MKGGVIPEDFAKTSVNILKTLNEMLRALKEEDEQRAILDELGEEKI